MRPKSSASLVFRLIRPKPSTSLVSLPMRLEPSASQVSRLMRQTPSAPSAARRATRALSRSSPPQRRQVSVPATAAALPPAELAKACRPVFYIGTGEAFKQSAELTGEPIKMKA